jgi:hypothetical protein
MVLDHNERECQGGLILRLDYYEAYNFDTDYGHVHYTMCIYEEKPGFDEVTGDPVLDGNGGQAITIYKWPLKSGSIQLDATTCNAWGADDQIIFDYVAVNIGLILI